MARVTLVLALAAGLAFVCVQGGLPRCCIVFGYTGMHWGCLLLRRLLGSCTHRHMAVNSVLLCLSTSF